MPSEETSQAQVSTAGAAPRRRLGPRVLDRAVSRELLAPFLFGLFAFLCILLGMETLYDLVTMMTRENFTLGEIGRIFVYRLPKMVAFTFPMSTLLAAVLGYNRLSGDGELTAMLAGGISFFRIEAIGVAFAAVIAVMTYCLGEAIVPRAEKAAEEAILAGRFKSVVRHDVFFRIPGSGPLRSIVLAKDYNYLEGRMTGLTIVEYDKKGEFVAAYKAEEGVWREHRWELHNVRFDAGPFTGTTANIKTLDPIERAPTPRDIAGRREQPSEMDRAELRRYIGERRQRIEELRSTGGNLDEPIRRLRDLTIQYHLRIAMPVSCVAFALVGIPLGIRPRRASSSMSLGLAVLIVFGYYVFFNFLNILGQRGVLTPFVTAWLANVIAISVGLGLSIERSR